MLYGLSPEARRWRVWLGFVVGLLALFLSLAGFGFMVWDHLNRMPGTQM